MNLEIQGSQYGFILPEWQIVVKGNKATLKCISFRSVRWTRDSILYGIKNKNSPELIISNVRSHDSGTYYCSGTLPNNTEFKASSKVLVGGKYTFYTQTYS